MSLSHVALGARAGLCLMQLKHQIVQVTLTGYGLRE